jgi:Neprosin
MAELFLHHLHFGMVYVHTHALAALALVTIVFASAAAASAATWPAAATSSGVGADGYLYSWALAYQDFPRGAHVTGLWVLQQNEQPTIDAAHGTASGHSLGQLWAIDRHSPACMSSVEIGWAVSPEQYGDLQPHLFVYAWDCGVGLGYVGQSQVPWVQISDAIAPNAVLGHGPALHMYGTELRGGDWWFGYDGRWLGYTPSSAWTRRFPSAITEAEVGGEVAVPGYGACTTMGNEGRYGADSRAALVSGAWYERARSRIAARLKG